MTFDGLDANAGAVKALRQAVGLVGGGRVPTVAAWSTGADCTAATANDAQCLTTGISY